jgi:hypothetical protein
MMVMGYADGYSLAQNKYRVKYRANLHVDDHRLYLPDCHKTALADLKATLVQRENSLTISSNIVHYFS